MTLLDLRSSASATPVVLPMNRRSTFHRFDQLDQPGLSQIILSSAEGLPAQSVSLALPESYLSAMQHLVKCIAQLRSSGALTEAEAAEPSPALLAAVATETQAVLDQSSATLVQRPAPEAPGWEKPAVVQSLQQLIPYLLWEVAQSTHEVMQLLEGTTAQVQQNGRWQTGVLRLLVILHLSSATQTDCFDLVTQQPPVLLSSDHPVHIPHSLLASSPLTAAALLQRLTIQLDRNQPELRSFFAGFSADWLMPGQSWQTGRVELSLGFAFTPAADSTSASGDSTQPVPMLKFGQTAWLEQQITTVVEHQLTQILQQQILPLSEETAHLLQSDSTITAQQAGQLAVVTRGCHAIDELQRSVMLASRTFAQHSLTLDELALRLLWNINRTAYEVMQCMSGISGRLLQPGGRWSMGRLRFVVTLRVQTPEQQWHFDLASRTLYGATAESPAPETIVQSDHCAWCRQPVLLKTIADQIWQTLEQNAPEVALLRTETQATISTEAAPGQLGIVQLTGAFEYDEAIA